MGKSEISEKKKLFQWLFIQNWRDPTTKLAIFSYSTVIKDALEQYAAKINHLPNAASRSLGF